MPENENKTAILEKMQLINLFEIDTNFYIEA